MAVVRCSFGFKTRSAPIFRDVWICRLKRVLKCLCLTPNGSSHPWQSLLRSPPASAASPCHRGLDTQASCGRDRAPRIPPPAREQKAKGQTAFPGAVVVCSAYWRCAQTAAARGSGGGGRDPDSDLRNQSSGTPGGALNN